LCALSTSGTLTAEEWQQLREHLAGCTECRQAKRQYEALIAHTIPALAPDSETLDPSGGPGSWSPEAAEEALLRRLRAEGKTGIPEPAPPPLSIYRWSPWRRWGAAAALLIAFCAIGYTAGIYEGKRSVHRSQPAALARNDHPQPSGAQTRADLTPVLLPNTGEVDKRQAELRALRSALADLREQKTQLEQRLSQKDTDLNRGTEERAALDKKLAATEASLQTLQGKFDLTAEQSRQETAQFVEQQANINELRASLSEREQKVTQAEQLLEHDRDIRNLIGARDLYIAEIYDIAKNGDTQKPFGRVFYTKGKSLVFYAYDLDQQPGVKRASTFQAWGRIGSDTKHDRNLGIFYQDDISKQRWILKSNDAKTLAQIDAVFVTVEPNGESAKPSGKPLLFTYLRMTPNHP
jgi:hypothetical protein